jgi:hypothetical protein
MMTQNNLLDLIKSGLKQAGLDADVLLNGNEVVIRIPSDVAAQLLLSNMPAQYKNVIYVKEIGPIVLGIKLG